MTAVLPARPAIAATAGWTTAAESPVGVLGCGGYVPARAVCNTELAGLLDVDTGWIEQRTGVLERHWASPGESTSDVATEAARRALTSTGVRPEQLGVIVVATSSARGARPASMVQQRLGATGAAAIDIGSRDFVSALSVAHRLVLATGGYGLVVGAEVHAVDPFDRDTAALVGDGAGAVVIGATWHGRGLQAVQLPAVGGPGSPADAVEEFLRGVRVDPGCVAHAVAHRPGSSEPSLGLPSARTHARGHELGDTGAAAIPLALADADIAAGERVLLAGIGTADTPALALLTW